MFRADSCFEIYVPPFLQQEGAESKQFQVVEQCFNVPLWYVQVLPKKREKGEFQRWVCYLASRAGDALGILLNQEWESVRLHVVLPQYMTQMDSLLMARCTALWECEANNQKGQVSWLFETNIGSFVDPEFEVLEPTSVRKIAARWIDYGNTVAGRPSE